MQEVYNINNTLTLYINVLTNASNNAYTAIFENTIDTVPYKLKKCSDKSNYQVGFATSK